MDRKASLDLQHQEISDSSMSIVSQIAKVKTITERHGFTTASQDDILGRLDLYRVEATRHLHKEQRAALGQFLTPTPVAQLMASMMSHVSGQDITLLDPGAGVGTLFSACVDSFCSSVHRPRSIKVTAFELDQTFASYLDDAVELCRSLCSANGIEFDATVINQDFIVSATSSLRGDLFASPAEEFTHAILNPPYRKIQTDSRDRKLLSTCGIETSNLYTAFVALTSMLLDDAGQMVSITPRSFCNGPYFKSFRKQFLGSMQIERLHVFNSRTATFQEDDVLQETVIMSARKGRAKCEKVTISSSDGARDECHSIREADRFEVIRPNDPEAFIQIVPDELEGRIANLASRFDSSLNKLGIEVSTGRVVDFRVSEFIEELPQHGGAPLIYPAHFEQGFVKWPLLEGKRFNGIRIVPETEDQLVRSGHYVLVKRFSAKEERRRIVAAVYNANRFTAEQIGFENHLNYFHKDGHGVTLDVAKGLAAYLNSTIVDTWFRHFSGHTQVNAVDLRSLRYPTLNELGKLGESIREVFPPQGELDRIIGKELLGMPENDTHDNPLSAKNKIEEALSVLKQMGFPRAQLNERSALTLLALLGLRPATKWSKATTPLCGITPMMEFFAQHYGKTYKPNTRETVRRQTVHQFLDAGMIVENPDEPERPTNSPKAVYQIEAGALELLKTFGTKKWGPNVKTYLASRKSLAERYAQERETKRIWT